MKSQSGRRGIKISWTQSTHRDQGAQSVDSLLVTQDGLADGGNRETDGPAGVALQVDDLVRALYDLLVEVVPVLRVVGLADLGIQVLQVDAANVDSTPDWHRRVAMLADDPAVAAWRSDAQLLADKVSQTSRVQVGATADDSVGWQAAELPSDVGQDVDWIGDDQEEGVRTVLDKSWDHS